MMVAPKMQSKPLHALLAGLTSNSVKMDLVISDLSLDSRQVTKGALFVALPGTNTNGANFIDDALAKGASAVLIDDPGQAQPGHRKGIPLVPVKDLARHTSEIAARFFDHPSRALWVAGITGTNGKTSCAWWLQQLLNLDGIPSASLGTLGIARASRIDANSESLTTLDAVSLQRRLALLRAQGLEAVAIEVSSHGLEQHRVDAVNFDLAIFTNLTQDHLDFHGDLRSYANAKRRLFELPGVNKSLVNIDDAMGRELQRSVGARPDTLSYSLTNAEADFSVIESLDTAVIDARISTPWGELRIANPRIVGRHNLANLLAVIAAACIQGVNPQRAAELLGLLTPVPGRTEMVSDPDDDITVVVDFAHTPDAVAQILQSLRQVADGQLHAVLGAGGDRDRSKRPLMAEAAFLAADHMVITSDNPRSEDPAAIAADMLAGLADRSATAVILDRAEAIETTIAKAAPGDCVAILGKGHESHQIIGERRLPFSDAATARRALQLRRGRQS